MKDILQNFAREFDKKVWRADILAFSTPIAGAHGL
jgi:hypothetical protein